jgi:hypothetical protein
MQLNKTVLEENKYDLPTSHLERLKQMISISEAFKLYSDDQIKKSIETIEKISNTTQLYTMLRPIKEIVNYF